MSFERETVLDVCGVLKFLKDINLKPLSYCELQTHAGRLGIRKNIAREGLYSSLRCLQCGYLPDSALFTLSGLAVRTKLNNVRARKKKRKTSYRVEFIVMINTLRKWEDLHLKSSLHRDYPPHLLRIFSYLHGVYLFTLYGIPSSKHMNTDRLSNKNIEDLRSLRCWRER